MPQFCADALCHQTQQESGSTGRGRGASCAPKVRETSPLFQVTRLSHFLDLCQKPPQKNEGPLKSLRGAASRCENGSVAAPAVGAGLRAPQAGAVTIGELFLGGFRLGLPGCLVWEREQVGTASTYSATILESWIQLFLTHLYCLMFLFFRV